jgi:hypothetical protein
LLKWPPGATLNQVISIPVTIAQRSANARICRNEGVAYTYIYEPVSIFTHGSLGAAAAFSTVPVGNQIADYERLPARSGQRVFSAQNIRLGACPGRR